MYQALKTINSRFYPGHLFYEPQWIVLGVNNICNLHCKMCDVGTQNLESTFANNLVGSKPLNMPIETTMQIIDETALYFPKSKIAYAFTEPLVYPHLVQTLAYANEKNIYTSLTTNALTLPQKAAALVASGLNEINVSLDGPEVIHNEIRGNQKSFARAIEGIQKLRSLSKEIKITVICAITEWNQEHLYEFAKGFRKLGLNELAFMHTQFTTQEVSDQHNMIWREKYPSTDSNLDILDLKNMIPSLLHDQISSIRNDDYDFNIYFSPDLHTQEEIERYYHAPEQFMGKRCVAVLENIMIKSNGNVIPAHGRCYNFTIGNIHDNHIKSIWNSEKIRNLRNDLKKAGGLLPACSRCCSGFSD